MQRTIQQTTSIHLNDQSNKTHSDEESKYLYEVKNLIRKSYMLIFYH
jgi:hypothetical protein